MKKKSKLDLTDFYYCAEQKIVSLVTSFFENSVRSGMEVNTKWRWQQLNIERGQIIDMSMSTSIQARLRNCLITQRVMSMSCLLLGRSNSKEC